MKQSMSIEEARELAELTDRIVSNLKTINDDGSNFDDLEEMEKQTGEVACNLRFIEEHTGSYLDALLEETNSIVSNLQTINESEG